MHVNVRHNALRAQQCEWDLTGTLFSQSTALWQAKNSALCINVQVFNGALLVHSTVCSTMGAVYLYRLCDRFALGPLHRGGGGLAAVCASRHFSPPVKVYSRLWLDRAESCTEWAFVPELTGP